MSREGLALLLLVGCTGRTATSDLVVSLQAVTREHDVEMNVYLGIRGHTTSLGFEQYGIEPDEHLAVGYGEQSVELIFNNVPQGSYHAPYYGTLPLAGPLAADQEVWLELDRGSGDDVRIAALPPPPVIIQAPATTPATSDLTVQWSPTWTAPMTWRVYSPSLISSAYGPINDDVGMLTFPRDVVATFCSYTCTADLTLERPGSANPASGFFTANVLITQVGYAHVQVTR